MKLSTSISASIIGFLYCICLLVQLKPPEQENKRFCPHHLVYPVSEVGIEGNITGPGYCINILVLQVVDEVISVQP